MSSVVEGSASSWQREVCREGGSFSYLMCPRNLPVANTYFVAEYGIDGLLRFGGSS